MTALPALPSSHDHSTDNAAYSSSNYFSSDDDNDTDCMFPLVRSTRTPQVLWHQNDSTIYVTIMITGVLKYHIKWNVTHLQFRYEHLGKMIIAHYLLLLRGGAFYKKKL